MSKYIRVIFYVLVAIVTVIAVQRQKGVILEKKKVTPESVLGLLMENGVPVETYTVVRKDILETVNVALENCGAQSCFYQTSKYANDLNNGDKIYDVADGKVIGQITRVSGVDPFTGLVRANVKLDQKPKDEKDRFTIVRVGTKIIKNALAIPTGSISYSKDSAYIWMYNDGKPKKQNIVLGVQSNELSEVKKGLNDGDIMVSRGQGLLYLYDKARVASDNLNNDTDKKN